MSEKSKGMPVEINKGWVTHTIEGGTPVEVEMEVPPTGLYKAQVGTTSSISVSPAQKGEDKTSLSTGTGMSAPEPPPKHNTYPEIWPLVITDMQERHEAGVEKYGVGLQPFNGRRALRDAYQEVLDQAVYIRQRIFEEENVSSFSGMFDLLESRLRMWEKLWNSLQNSTQNKVVLEGVKDKSLTLADVQRLLGWGESAVQEWLELHGLSLPE